MRCLQICSCYKALASSMPLACNSSTKINCRLGGGAFLFGRVVSWRWDHWCLTSVGCNKICLKMRYDSCCKGRYFKKCERPSKNCLKVVISTLCYFCDLGYLYLHLAKDYQACLILNCNDSGWYPPPPCRLLVALQQKSLHASVEVPSTSAESFPGDDTAGVPAQSVCVHSSVACPHGPRALGVSQNSRATPKVGPRRRLLTTVISQVVPLSKQQ